MFVAHDQENVVHAHQTAAAAKSLAGGGKALGAKTPTNKAPKTPFKASLNDENIYKTGKNGLKPNGKGNENFLQTTKKGGDLDKNAFITPAGPRTRAPLGMKTTNAKAKAFMTPAPAGLNQGSIKTHQQKSKSPRLRRPKVKILQESETEQGPKDEEEPDIEHMPKRIEPLPDYPEDFPPDLNLSMFKGPHFTRGMYSMHYDPEEEERRTLQEAEKAFKKTDELIMKACEASFDEAEKDLKELHDPEEAIRSVGAGLTAESSKENFMKRPNSVARGAPGTMASKSAASALTSGRKPVPKFAAPTPGTKARRPTAFVAGKSSAPTTSAAANAQAHAVATAAAKSTVGYARGRAVSTSVRPALGSTKAISNGRTIIKTVDKAQSKRPGTHELPQPRQSSSISLATARKTSQQSNDTAPKKFTYKDETELLNQLRYSDRSEYDDEEFLPESNSGSLLLDDDAFEEFKFDLPPF